MFNGQNDDGGRQRHAEASPIERVEGDGRRGGRVGLIGWRGRGDAAGVVDSAGAHAHARAKVPDGNGVIGCGADAGQVIGGGEAEVSDVETPDTTQDGDFLARGVFDDVDGRIGPHVGISHDARFDGMDGDGRNAEGRRFWSVVSRLFAREDALELEEVAGGVGEGVIVHEMNVPASTPPDPSHAELLFVRHVTDLLPRQ